MDLFEITYNDIDCIKSGARGALAGTLVGIATLPFPVSSADRDIRMMIQKSQNDEGQPSHHYARWHQLTQRAGAYGHAAAIATEAILDGRVALAHLAIVSVLAGGQILYNAVFDK